MRTLSTVFLSIFVLCGELLAQKPNILHPDYNHDKYAPKCEGVYQAFRAFCSCFDDEDDDNGDGISDIWGVPEFVSYQLKRTSDSCLKTIKRPSWFHDKDLVKRKVMPKDDSYTYSESFRKVQGDWFERGHLAAKLHAERLGNDAAYNTHTFSNCVPQRKKFNKGIWNDLEDLTGAWAQQFGEVWIMTGPIFADRSPFAYLGEGNELRVAIPEALFKIVVREDSVGRITALAFIYPQVGASYLKEPEKDYDHRLYLTSILEIEQYTGLKFFPNLSDNERNSIVAIKAGQVWPARDKDFIKACKKKQP